MSFYTASFIAEIVRGGIKPWRKGKRKLRMHSGFVPHHDTSDRRAAGDAHHHSALTSQFLKPHQELVACCRRRLRRHRLGRRTILNQTGQALKSLPIWLVIYLRIPVHGPGHELVQRENGFWWRDDDDDQQPCLRAPDH